MAYIQIVESQIKNTISVFEQTYNETPQNLVRALMNGSLFKSQGLTPFYILDEENQDIITTSLENMDNRLN